MEATMDHEALQSLATELARTIKTPGDLSELGRMLTKLTVEAALNAEMTEHLGYDKHQKSAGGGRSNARNGSSPKRLKGQHGELEIQTPRDRDGSFEPRLVAKHQTRLTTMDDQVLTLYAKGMSTREITQVFKEMYGADVSPTLVSKITERVIEEVTRWQARPLDPIYPIVYLDCIVLKIRSDMRVINKSCYLALGINLDGHKELLGLWLAENEGAKFWLSVLTELKTRGVQDMLIACVDGLTGFPEAIAAEYPQTRIQLCIVHMVRNSLRYVSWKDYKAVTADLKRIYQASTEAAAQLELQRFGDTWDAQYPKIAQSWANHWPNLITLFEYPPDIRKAIYTTNAIESLNSVIRAATKRRKAFPSDASALKVVYLAMSHASTRWTMPIQNWRKALSRFVVQFDDRLKQYL